MESSPPIKPPRGVKSTKETSSVLMSFIDTLYKSDSIEERDREKAKLELEYLASDKKLNELVLKHEGDLTNVMQLFGTLSEQINTAQRKIRTVKANLKSCKTLLHCKKDDLKKLWLEGLEYKHMIQLLEEIEKMSQIPKAFNAALNKKHYLHATELLVEAIHLGKGSLAGVDAVKELSLEVEQKMAQLQSKMMHDLKQHLFVKPSQQVLAMGRQGSGFANSPLRRSAEVRHSARKSQVRRNIFEEETKEFNLIEDVDAIDPEADSAHFIAIIIKSLALLDKLPLAIDEINEQMQNELVQLVYRTTYHVTDIAQMQQVGELASKQSKQLLLIELVQTLFEQFKHIGMALAIALEHFANAAAAYNVDVILYDMQTYWMHVQSVLQQLLTDYLDVKNVSNVETQMPDALGNPNDISAHFSRRKQQGKKKTMFKFDDSSSALLTSKHAQHSGIVSKRKDKVFICLPDHNNILYVYIPFMCFVEDVETLANYKEESQCVLHKFLSEYVNDIFLTRRHIDTLQLIKASVLASDAWKSTHLIGLSTDYKPLLISTTNVERYIRDWRKVLAALPFCGENIVKYVCNALKDYRETCNAAYCGIVQPHSEDKRILSATWLKDADISRFLKSLPNWQNLKSMQEFQARSARRHQIRREHTLEEESPEDVRQRNRREAEMLASNLSEDGVSAGEILSDMGLLKELAQLQESMEWFAVQMLQFASEFRHDPTLSPTTTTFTPASDHHTPITATTLQKLTSVAQDFDELANTCLLLLHLEVRVQCFHYLLAPNDSNKETHEPDPKVLELSRVLANVDEAMTSSLHGRKCKYIFEGLGHLIAKILISSSQFMPVINEAGIQRMSRNVFALQQTLTNITMTREVALDHARHYFELFFLTPEEILSEIMENGPQFSELEYMNAFHLLNRSEKGNDLHSINTTLDRLSEILREVANTV